MRRLRPWLWFGAALLAVVALWLVFRGITMKTRGRRLADAREGKHMGR